MYRHLFVSRLECSGCPSIMDVYTYRKRKQTFGPRTIFLFCQNMKPVIELFQRLMWWSAVLSRLCITHYDFSISQSASMITQCWWLKHARIPSLILPFFIVTHHPTVTVQTNIGFKRPGKQTICIASTQLQRSPTNLCVSILMYIYAVSTLCPLIFYWTLM